MFRKYQAFQTHVFFELIHRKLIEHLLNVCLFKEGILSHENAFAKDILNGSSIEGEIS